MKNLEKELNRYSKNQIIKVLAAFAIGKEDSILLSLKNLKLNELLDKSDLIIKQQKELTNTMNKCTGIEFYKNLSKHKKLEKKLKNINNEIDSLLNIKENK